MVYYMDHTLSSVSKFSVAGADAYISEPNVGLCHFRDTVQDNAIAVVSLRAHIQVRAGLEATRSGIHCFRLQGCVWHIVVLQQITDPPFTFSALVSALLPR